MPSYWQKGINEDLLDLVQEAGDAEAQANIIDGVVKCDSKTEASPDTQ